MLTKCAYFVNVQLWPLYNCIPNTSGSSLVPRLVSSKKKIARAVAQITSRACREGKPLAFPLLPWPCRIGFSAPQCPEKSHPDCLEPFWSSFWQMWRKVAPLKYSRNSAHVSCSLFRASPSSFPNTLVPKALEFGIGVVRPPTECIATFPAVRERSADIKGHTAAS